MKYVIDLPHELSNNGSIRVQYFPPNSNTGVDRVITPVKVATFSFEGVPLHVNPTFAPLETLYPAKDPSFEIGVALG